MKLQLKTSRYRSCRIGRRFALIVAPVVTTVRRKPKPTNAMGMMAKQNVAEVAMSAPQFSRRWLTAVKAAGLALRP